MALDIDIDELRLYASMPEDDDSAEALRDAAMDYIERHLGRALEQKQRTEGGRVTGGVILLAAYPVSAISSLTVGGETYTVNEDYWYNAENGVITLFHHEAEGRAYQAVYTGGYTEATLPRAFYPALALIADALKQAGQNGGQQITYQMLDGYAVTYSSKYNQGEELSALSPAAAILLSPFKGRAGIR